MEEFEPSSDAWNREWKSSRRVRGLESGMEEFEPRSGLGIGNGVVRAKFEVWNRKWRSSSQVPTLEIGNGRVRAKFEAWNREWRSLRQVHGLESGMEEFEPSSRFAIGNGRIRVKFR